MQKKPKILYWDIETSYAVVAAFQLLTEYIPPDNIIQDWHILSVSYMFEGDRKPSNISIKKYGDDKMLVKKVRDIVAQADLIVHHNGNDFDLKKFNARLIKHGFEPLPPIPCVDTRKQAMKIARFTSNKLDYLGDFLGLGRKDNISGSSWMQLLKGDMSVISRMAKYNDKDVVLLRKLYLKLRPYMKDHPNLALYESSDLQQCECGSKKFQRRGTYITKTRRYARYQCQGCGSWSRSMKSEKV